MRELRIADMPDDLHRALKQAALDNDTTLREVCFQILEKGIKDFVKKPETLRKRPRIKKLTMGE